MNTIEIIILSCYSKCSLLEYFKKNKYKKGLAKPCKFDYGFNKKFILNFKI